MKSSISHVLAFILMILIVFASTFISLRVSFNSKNVIRVLEKNNYYEESYSKIYKEIDDYVINDELNGLYKKYVTKELVKKDINSIINNFYSKKESQINRYDDFYEIFINYNSDSEIAKVYAGEINDIYVRNIFPTSEFNLLNKVYFGSLDFLFGLIIDIVGILLISAVLAIINKNFKYHTYALSGYSIFVIVISVLIKIIFRDFMYTNEYFTKFLMGIISNIFIYQIVVAFIIIACLFILKKITKLKV